MRYVLPALFALTLGSQAFADNKKSLIFNGVNAATYGDILGDMGKWRQDDFMALRLRLGVQLIRWDFVGVGVGFQKVGFYDAERNLDRPSSNPRFDYRGPFAEVYLFPNSLFGFSLALSGNKGYQFRSGLEDKEYGDDASVAAIKTSCSLGADGCRIRTEKSELTVQEVAGQLTWTVAPHIQIVFGMGTRNYKASHPIYQLDANVGKNKDGSDNIQQYEHRSGAGKWKDSGSFFTFGIRGTNL